MTFTQSCSSGRVAATGLRSQALFETRSRDVYSDDRDAARKEALPVGVLCEDRVAAGFNSGGDVDGVGGSRSSRAEEGGGLKNGIAQADFFERRTLKEAVVVAEEPSPCVRESVAAPAAGPSP